MGAAESSKKNRRNDVKSKVRNMNIIPSHSQQKVYNPQVIRQPSDQLYHPPIYSEYPSHSQLPHQQPISTPIFETIIIPEETKSGFKRIEPIDTASEILKNDLLMEFHNFFKTKFTKLENVEGRYSKYVCAISTMISKFRYIIILTRINRDPSGTEKTIEELIPDDILCLQTRTSERNTYLLNKQGYVGDNSKKRALNDVIELEESTTDKSTYISNKYPVKLELLHKNGSKHEYAPELNIKIALETFNCIIRFDG